MKWRTEAENTAQMAWNQQVEPVTEIKAKLYLFMDDIRDLQHLVDKTHNKQEDKNQVNQKLETLQECIQDVLDELYLISRRP